VNVGIEWCKLSLAEIKKLIGFDLLMGYYGLLKFG